MVTPLTCWLQAVVSVLAGGANGLRPGRTLAAAGGGKTTAGKASGCGSSGRGKGPKTGSGPGTGSSGSAVGVVSCACSPAACADSAAAAALPSAALPSAFCLAKAGPALGSAVWPCSTVAASSPAASPTCTALTEPSMPGGTGSGLPSFARAAAPSAVLSAGCLGCTAAAKSLLSCSAFLATIDCSSDAAVGPRISSADTLSAKSSCMPPAAATAPASAASELVSDASVLLAYAVRTGKPAGCHSHLGRLTAVSRAEFVTIVSILCGQW